MLPNYEKNQNEIDKFKKSNIYSTEEQVIGTWIDGKKIYRKVLTGTTPAKINTIGQLKDFTSSLDTVINLRAFIKLIQSSGNLFVEGNYQDVWAINTASKDIVYAIKDSAYCNMPFHVVVEYTKE